MQVKQTGIVDKIRKSIDEYGKQPHCFSGIVISAIDVLEPLITRMFKKDSREVIQELANMPLEQLIL